MDEDIKIRIKASNEVKEGIAGAESDLEAFALKMKTVREGASGGSKGEKGSGDGILAGLSATKVGLKEVAARAGEVYAIYKGGEVALRGASVLWKSLTGDIEGAADASDKVADAISDIPLVGDKLKNIFFGIDNELSAVANWLKGDGFVGWQDQAEDAKKYAAQVDATTEAMLKNLKTAQEINAAADAMAQGEKNRQQQSGFTPAQMALANIQQKQSALEDLSDKYKQTSPTGEDSLSIIEDRKTLAKAQAKAIEDIAQEHYDYLAKLQEDSIEDQLKNEGRGAEAAIQAARYKADQAEKAAQDESKREGGANQILLENRKAEAQRANEELNALTEKYYDDKQKTIKQREMDIASEQSELREKELKSQGRTFDAQREATVRQYKNTLNDIHKATQEAIKANPDQSKQIYAKAIVEEKKAKADFEASLKDTDKNEEKAAADTNAKLLKSRIASAEAGLDQNNAAQKVEAARLKIADDFLDKKKALVDVLKDETATDKQKAEAQRQIDQLPAQLAAAQLKAIRDNAPQFDNEAGLSHATDTRFLTGVKERYVSDANKETRADYLASVNPSNPENNKVIDPQVGESNKLLQSILAELKSRPNVDAYSGAP